MGRRVVAVDPAAEHGDRDAADVERAAMRLAVDPASQAADDDEPGCRQLAPERPRDRAAVRRAGAGADDRNRRAARAARRTPRRAARAPPAGRGSPRGAAGTEQRRAGGDGWSCRRNPDGRAVRERLGEVLRQHRVGAGERRDRAGDPSDAGTPAARERHALDSAVEQRRCRLGAAQARRRPGAAHGPRPPARAPSPTASPGGAASSSARGRGIATTRSNRSSSARDTFSR